MIASGASASSITSRLPSFHISSRPQRTIALRSSSDTGASSRTALRSLAVRTRILLAEPLYIFRSGLRTLAEREPDVELLDAADLDGLLGAASEARPDVAIVDLALPPAGGLPAVERLPGGPPAARVVGGGVAPGAAARPPPPRAGA